MKTHLFIIVMLVFSSVFIIVPMEKHPVSATDYSTWGLYRQMWVDTTNVDADLVNFPVLVSISDAIGDKCQSDGDDVRFTSSDNNTLYPHNIEKWTDGSNRLVWVRIPRVDDAANTTFWFHYNNPSAAGLTNWTDVWGVYNYVLHMNGTTTIQDYTANNHDGSSTADANTGGVVASCQLFTAANTDKVNMGDHADFTYSDGSHDTAFTVSLWSKPTIVGSGPDQQFLFAKDASSNREYRLAYYWNGATKYLEAYIFDSSLSKYQQIVANYVISQTAFQLITLTYNGNEKANGLDIYVNGTILARACTNASSYTCMENLGESLLLGDYGYSDIDTYNGYMDEVRAMKSTCQNASWVKAEYYSITAPTTFVQMSRIQRGTEIIPPITPSAPVYFEALSQNNTWIKLNWTHGASSVDKTVIRANQGSYPSLSVGSTIYNGTLHGYNHTGLTNNTHWFYRCYAWNSTGTGCYNATNLRSHDTTMGIPILDINMDLNNCTGSYTQELIYSISYEDAGYNELPADCQDGDWSTSAALPGFVYYFIQYLKPTTFISGGKWMVKDGVDYINFTITDAVLNLNASSPYLTFYIYYNDMESFISYNVVKGVDEFIGGIVLSSSHITNTFFEESITWNVTGWAVNFTAESQLNLTFNLTHAVETHFAVWNTPFWDIIVNATGNISGLVIAENIVNAVGTHDYQWRPLLGVNGEWWVWANYTGTAATIFAGENLTIINPNPGNGTHSENYLKKDAGGLTTSVDVTYINFTTPPAPFPGTYNMTINSTLFTNTPATWNTSTVYASVWNNATGGIVANAYLYVGQMMAVPDYTTFRSYLLFNTSSLPDEAEIDDAYVQLTIEADFSDTDFNVTLQNVKPPKPHNPLIPSDYSKAGVAGHMGLENTSGYVAEDLFNITIKPSGLADINHTGITRWALRSNKDINATSPNMGDNEWIIFYGNGMPVAKCPKLFINYTIPAHNWVHYVNLTWYSNSSGAWLPYYYSNVNSNGTVTVPAVNFSGVSPYWWNVSYNSNHTNYGNSTVWNFETVATSGGSSSGGGGSRVTSYLLIGLCFGGVGGALLWGKKQKRRKP